MKRALKIENYINEEDLFEPEELILDSIIDIKTEYPDDDIIDISEYSQGEPRINRRNIRMIGQMMKEDMDDYSKPKRSRQSIKLKDDYPFDKKHFSKNKILKYLAEEDDDYKDEIILDESN